MESTRVTEMKDIKFLKTTNDNALVKFSDSSIGYLNIHDKVFCSSDINDYNKMLTIIGRERESKITKRTYNISSRLIDFYQAIGSHDFYHNIFNLTKDRGDIKFERISLVNSNVMCYVTTIKSIINQIRCHAVDEHPHFIEFEQKLAELDIEFFDVNELEYISNKELYILISNIMMYFGADFMNVIENTDTRVYIKEIINDIEEKYESSIFRRYRKYVNLVQIEVCIFDGRGKEKLMKHNHVLCKIDGVDIEFNMQFNPSTLTFTFDFDLSVLSEMDKPIKLTDKKRNKINNQAKSILQHLNGTKFLTFYRMMYIKYNNLSIQ